MSDTIPERLKIQTLAIEGMHCASCVSAVEKSLGHLAGVQQATVNLATESATVQFDPHKVDYSELRKAVEHPGGAEVRTTARPDRADARRREHRDQRLGDVRHVAGDPVADPDAIWSHRWYVGVAGGPSYAPTRARVAGASRRLTTVAASPSGSGSCFQRRSTRPSGVGLTWVE